MNKESVTGIILAGGRSRRFGEPKALVTWRGESLITYSIRALQPFVKDVTIVSHLPELHQLKDMRVIEDKELYKGQGPLAGILTVMEKINTCWYFVLPCDVPLISSRIVLMLLQQLQGKETHEVVVPYVNGRVQPLIGLYHHRVKEKIECQLKGNKKSMMELLEQCKVLYVSVQALSIEETSFININTKKDYTHLLEL
ncbi:molybdenum cofactor guanylyltransferase [Terrilactibacillus laevilacticus]|uniref:Probable molybdenum cofactor guanylyltransferase n=1 Tax=Terrilactibacillus laevilacticus TaxID=1380157 RepID=A0ABW5PVD0_9BACI|nr:molybdenum cofactor guanylyltransferase [Terrilactibacillus laevilacticus]